MDWNSSEESTPPGTTLVRGFKLSARDSLASVPPCLRGSGHDEFQGTPACWFGVGVKGTRCCPVCRNGLSGKLCGRPQTKGKIGHHHSGSLGDSYRCCLLFPFLFVLVHGSGVGFPFPTVCYPDIGFGYRITVCIICICFLLCVGSIFCPSPFCTPTIICGCFLLGPYFPSSRERKMHTKTSTRSACPAQGR